VLFRSHEQQDYLDGMPATDDVTLLGIEFTASAQ
jgi:hypothetical protein